MGFGLQISNYLYGLTSVKLKPYVLGSCLGMLPGTFLYVQAGSTGRALLDTAADGGGGLGDSGLLTAVRKYLNYKKNSSLLVSVTKTKQNKTKQNKTKQNKTKQNKTKQNKTKQPHVRQTS
jgi:uncharacterized membrane protein YdjX (TVP38/TMEM64 family)